MARQATTKRKAFDTCNCTPRLHEVLLTAKHLASPDASINSQHLLRALEVDETVASKALKALGISPSSILGHSPPPALIDNGDLHCDDFDEHLKSGLLDSLKREAKDLQDWYLGTNHLLLVLARSRSAERETLVRCNSGKDYRAYQAAMITEWLVTESL